MPALPALSQKPRMDDPKRLCYTLTMGGAMEQTTLKAKMERLIHNLPEEASIEEVMEKLYLLYKIEKGIQQADAGNTVSHEEAKKRLQEWLD